MHHFLKSHKRNDNLDELDTYIENQGQVRANFKLGRKSTCLNFRNFALHECFTSFDYSGVRRGHLQVLQVRKWTYFFRQNSWEWHIAQNPAWEQITQESQTFEKMVLQLNTQDGVILKQEMEQWRAPKSRGETHLRVSQSQVAESWDSEARSRLPTLDRGRGSSWEPRD